MARVKTKEKTYPDESLYKDVSRYFRNLSYDLSSRQIRHWDTMGILKVTKDESGYRRFTTDDYDRITLILGLRELGLSLPRIKNILTWLLPNKEIVDKMKKDPLAFLSKYKDAIGKEEWYPKREYRDEIAEVKEYIKRRKEGLNRFEEIFSRAWTNIAKALLTYRVEAKKE